VVQGGGKRRADRSWRLGFALRGPESVHVRIEFGRLAKVMSHSLRRSDARPLPDCYSNKPRMLV
jgi:hypothetical protein